MTRQRLLSVVAIVFLARFAVAQTPVIRAIEVRNDGVGQIDETFITAHTRSRVGDELDRGVVSADVRDLLGTGAFSYVAVEAAPVDADVRLIYVVRPKLVLAAPFDLEGVDHFRERKVRDWIGLEVGDLVDDQVLGVQWQKVKEEYGKDHYLNVVATWELDVLDPESGRAAVTIKVDEGRRSRVTGVLFNGNDSVKDAELRTAMGFRSAWNPIGWFSKRHYDADAFEAGRQAMRAVYGDRGYLDARVGEVQSIRDDDGDVKIELDVEEGILYQVGEVTLEGITLFPEMELQRLVGIKPGQTAVMALLQQTRNDLSDYYTSRGYLNTRVRMTLDPVPDERLVNVRYTIKEGALTRIGNIRIRGNTRTRDVVIRRELLVYPGDIFDDVRARRSERRLMNTGFFETVRRLPESTSEPDTQNLVFLVEEKRTGQFMLGAGFSSVDNIIGYAELSQGNFDLLGWPYFTGGGQKLKLRAQFGETRKEYEMSFVEPWFMNRRLSLGFDLFRREYSYTDYDVERTGGSIGIGRALPWGNRMHVGYTLERSTVVDLGGDTNTYYYADDTLYPYMFDLNEDRIESSLRLTLLRDTRNNPFFPSRGAKTRVFGSISGGPLGFDTELYRLGLNRQQYMSLWFGHVLSVKGRYEIVEEYGDSEEVPLSSRLFIGGGRTIRGYDYRDVGPKVTRTPGAQEGGYKAVGGRSLAFGSVEYLVPVVSKIRLAAFYDIGSVWRDPYEFNSSELASGAGIGIRFDVPGFPIRIDRAWTVDKDSPLTDEDTWVIWIGYD